MRKVKRKNKKNRGLFLVVLAVLVVGIGFAALQKYLTIDGTASINSNFDVRFSYINTGDVVGGAYNKSEPTFTENTATFDAAFLAPGDSITYNIYVANQGTMNAKLENIDVNIDDNENISYEITGINVGDVLESHAYSEVSGEHGGNEDPTTKMISFKLAYKGTVSEQTSSKVKVTMKFSQTTEQTNRQDSAVALIESEKPTVTYDIQGLSNETNEYGVRKAIVYMRWNSDNYEEIGTYFLGVEVYREGNPDLVIVKNATEDKFITPIQNGAKHKIRNVYAINGVKYYSQYSDEFVLNVQNQEGFVYDAIDYTTILSTDDLYFTDGIVTLPMGRKIKKLSPNVKKVIIPESYDLTTLSTGSLYAVKPANYLLETIVNKTGKAIDWAPILGYNYSYDANGNNIKCEFVTGTCYGVSIVAE